MRLVKNMAQNAGGKNMLILLCDLLIAACALHGALLVRHGMEAIPESCLKLARWNGLFLLPCTAVVFAALGLYRSLWRYAGMREALLIVFACVIVNVASLLFAHLACVSLPQGSYLVQFCLQLLMTLGLRYSACYYHQWKVGVTEKPNCIAQNRDSHCRVMLIGGGEAGHLLIREINAKRALSLGRVVCVIDDDPGMKGFSLSGVPVVGGRDQIVAMAHKYAVDEIILAMPSAAESVKAEILNVCKETKCHLKTIPGIYQLVNGQVSVSKLRDVDIIDLLGRETVVINNDDTLGHLKGRTVLVTGGGGSIGSELCRQIAKYQPACLIIFDIYENNAYDIQNELRRHHPELNLVTLIGSVTDADRLTGLFERYHPEVVYHAAAYKHVPLMEDCPHEAVRNNVFGTYNLAQAADRFRVKRFVMISTDKAVNPTSVMGATKRICEMIVQSFNERSQTEFVAVRFGNVLGSNGSVIPLFRRQINEGGPVTVTHPDIIRYFMTIPEAVSLVLCAGAMAKGGEIFILDMGKPVKIVDLAKNLIRLSGLTPGVDIKIVYTGLRPGEKLYEELLVNEKGATATCHDRILVGHPHLPSQEALQEGLRNLRELLKQRDSDVRPAIARLVTSYHQPDKDKADMSA